MPKKILIVKDCSDISGPLKLLIGKEGYEAVVANSGADGRDKALSEKPDLILMDLALPDVSGLALTQELRALPATLDVPILCGPSRTEGIHAGGARGGLSGSFQQGVVYGIVPPDGKGTWKSEAAGLFFGRGKSGCVSWPQCSEGTLSSVSTLSYPTRHSESLNKDNK